MAMNDGSRHGDVRAGAGHREPSVDSQEQIKARFWINTFILNSKGFAFWVAFGFPLLANLAAYLTSYSESVQNFMDSGRLKPILLCIPVVKDAIGYAESTLGHGEAQRARGAAGRDS